jgi:electron transport complex protein RnfE
MFFTVLFYVIGFDIVMLLTGIIREFLAYGTINGKVTDVDMLISGLSQPFGGFIFLGRMCGVYRKIRSAIAERKNEAKESH